MLILHINESFPQLHLCHLKRKRDFCVKQNSAPSNEMREQRKWYFFAVNKFQINSLKEILINFATKMKWIRENNREVREHRIIGKLERRCLSRLFIFSCHFGLFVVEISTQKCKTKSNLSVCKLRVSCLKSSCTISSTKNEKRKPKRWTMNRENDWLTDNNFLHQKLCR